MPSFFFAKALVAWKEAERVRFGEHLSSDAKMTPALVEEAIWVLINCSEIRFNLLAKVLLDRIRAVTRMARMTPCKKTDHHHRRTRLRRIARGYRSSQDQRLEPRAGRAAHDQG